MNRALLFGIALFFAIVGLTLVGGQQEVVAGHRCNGASCDGGHHGRDRCHGRGHRDRDRCHGRGHHRRDRCNGRGHHRRGCNGGGCHGGYDGGKVMAGPVQKGDAVPPAPGDKGPAQAPQQK